VRGLARQILESPDRSPLALLGQRAHAVPGWRGGVGALLCASGKSAIGFFHGDPALAVLNCLPGWSPPVPAFEADDSYCEMTRGGR